MKVLCILSHRGIQQLGMAGLSGSVGCTSEEIGGSTPAGEATFFSWRFDHEIFSTVILSLPLIQEGQVSVSGEKICTILVNRLED